MTKLAQLKEFPHALIYGFDPEGSCRQVSLLEQDYHLVSQLDDMLEAYLFAQDNIPQDIQAITAPQLVGWVTGIHARMARSLAKDQNKYQTEQLEEAKAKYGSRIEMTLSLVVPGEYTQRMILRWHAGANLQDFVCPLLPGLFQANSFQGMLVLLADQMRQHFNIKPDDSMAFLQFVQTYGLALINNKKIPERLAVESLGDYVIDRIAHDWNEGTLGAENKKIVNKIVKPSLSPHLIPAAMENFCETTLAAWKACDRHDPDAVSRLVAKTFFELTEIHPFFNCNGRTATCFINLMLKSLGYPAILLRNPGEKAEADSSYSKAVKAMEEENWEPLAAHIKLRLGAPEYTNALLRSAMKNRIGCMELMQRLRGEFKAFDLEAYHKEITQRASEIFFGKTRPSTVPDHIKFEVSQYLYDRLDNKYNELKLSTPGVKATLESALKSMTGHAGWGVFGKDGVFAAIVLSEEKAESVVEGLKAYPELTVQKRDRLYPDDNFCLISVSNIKIDSLLAQSQEPAYREKGAPAPMKN